MTLEATIPTEHHLGPESRPADQQERPGRTYSVVGLSFPIVYSLEGDHDPNGLLYTLGVYRPLLKWAKEQWDRDDDYLPTLQRRCHLMEAVVYGLPRFKRMREILAAGPEQDRYLLGELGDEIEVGDRERRDRHRPPPEPRDRAVQQNYRTTVDDLVAALRELTRGRISRLSTDPEVLDRWRQEWLEQLDDGERALENRLRDIDFGQCVAAAAKESPELTPQHVERLMLNDRGPNRHYQPVGPRWDPGATTAYNRFNPLKPIPVVRPLVLRACRGDMVEVHFRNEIRGRQVGMHVQGDGLADGVAGSDGAHVGRNASSLVDYQRTRTYRWHCDREGVWPINDLGDVRGTDRGTNNHGLFAALVVEPEGARWYDPDTGERLDDTTYPDGLYVDVVPPCEHGLVEERQGRELDHVTVAPCPDGGDHTCAVDRRCRRWREENFVDFHSGEAKDRSFREFAVFFHDEPETHSGIPHPAHSAMPLSYRSEPMHNRVPYRLHRRLRLRHGLPPTPDAEGIDHAAVRIEVDDLLSEVFWVAEDLTADAGPGRFLERVSGEEQHHSSWLFGDAVTPILRAYKGDPCRVRLVHAGVKETHVYHLHVHQWRAVAHDTAAPSVWRPQDHHGSQLLDSISIGPQTGMTIDPLYGSGSRQHAVGDIIWHCHLYPHFHHGMWGLWRSFDRLVDGRTSYPDGTPCAALVPLPGREPDRPTEQRPGFPWFIDATYPRKSPPPPSPLADDVPEPARPAIAVDGRRQRLRMPNCSPVERAAFAPGCRDGSQPGALFVDLDRLARTWNTRAAVPEQRIVSYDVTMSSRPLQYNSAGWHDPHGHHYTLTGITVTPLDDDGNRREATSFPPPVVRADGGVDAFFPRANHGDIVELRLHNTVGTVEPDQFDFPGHPVECGLHVHLVKFDVLAADGSASGWNYLSGASSPEAIGPNQAGEPERNVSVHRWVVDEEFGTCFFHDHLLANFRQKRGLFAALIAEPVGTRWYLPDGETPAWVASQAVIVPRPQGDAGIEEPFREAGLALGDFVPLHRRNGDGLNEPDVLGGDDDPGVMGVNYRCAPMEYRGKDPSEWFSSNRSGRDDGSDGVWTADRYRSEDGPVGRRRGFEGRRPLDVSDASPYLPVPRKDRGDPDTPVIYTYAGERLRIRILQGSHEEQHSFMLNGLRWRRDWHNARSPLVNQQTLGISEAFTIDVDPRCSPYGPGDHLWQFTVLDDLWLGCWGLVRAFHPNASRDGFPSLEEVVHRAKAAAHGGDDGVAGAQAAVVEPTDRLGGTDPIESARAHEAGSLPWPRWRPTPERPYQDEPGGSYRPDGAKVRPYTIVVRRHEHLFAGHALTDPWGLIYRVLDPDRDKCEWEPIARHPAEGDAEAEHDAEAEAKDGVEAETAAGSGNPGAKPNGCEPPRHGTGNRRVILHDDHLPPGDRPPGEPLVLRAHPGEWLHVTLINEVLLPEEYDESYPCPHHPVADTSLPPFGPELNPPRVPVEHRDHLGYPDRRTVSPRVSMHPCLLQYDVVTDDGAYVGRNHDSTVAALDVDTEAHAMHDGDDPADAVVHRTDHGIGHRDPNWREYWWYVDDLLAPADHADGPGQVCYLFDMADVRNHRHHGLIGAVVVEPADLVPCNPDGDKTWTGPCVELRAEHGNGGVVAHEHVLFLQDGQRHFLRGDADQPVPDVSPSDPPVDAGQKAISYRSPLTPSRRPLANGEPPTPVFDVAPDLDIWLRLVCGGDKPRNHTFTLHDFAWDEAPWVEPGPGPATGAIGAIVAGYARDLVLSRKPRAVRPNGDHCYRSGAFRWAVTQGMWGILRIPDGSPEHRDRS